MKPSLTVSIALLTMAVFLLIEVSIKTNQYEFQGCILGSIPDCGFRQFKFAALIIFSCFTIVTTILQFLGFSKFTVEVNIIIGLISMAAIIVNVFAILANDYYKSINDRAQQQAYFWPLMGEMSVLIGMTGTSMILYLMNKRD